MFERDYIMRTIREMVRAVLKLLFNMDVSEKMEDWMEVSETSEDLRYLKKLVDAGRINEAENRIYEMTEQSDSSALKVALIFYAYLNEQTDEKLETNRFSREEIKQGLERLAELYDLGDMARLYLRD